jgi:hypothetical protein
VRSRGQDVEAEPLLTLLRVDGRLDRALAEAIAHRPKEAVRTIKGEGEEQEAEAAGGTPALPGPPVPLTRPSCTLSF